MLWENLFNYTKAFAIGGLLCVIAQLLIIKTKLTPARILVIFLVSGIILQTLGVYEFLYKLFGSGVSVPITGFGASLAKGSIELARTEGVVGAFAGGLIRTAYGIGAAVVASYVVTLVFSPKSK